MDHWDTTPHVPVNNTLLNCLFQTSDVGPPAKISYALFFMFELIAGVEMLQFHKNP